jgi:hypothetical protein
MARDLGFLAIFLMRAYPSARSAHALYCIAWLRAAPEESRDDSLVLL